MKAVYYKFTFLVLALTINHSITFSKPQIEIYTMPGCERCIYSTDYMKEHNINYVEYSIADDYNNSKLREMLQSSNNYDGGSVTMPVINKQGNVYFNINELESFLSDLEGSQNLNNENLQDNNIEAVNQISNSKNTNSKNLSDDQIKEFLDAHNSYRAEVNSDPLIWSNQLASYAKAWGEHLAQTGCELEHRPDNGEWAQRYGENIYWSSGFAPTPKVAVDSWGSEKPDYDGGLMNNKNFAAGHYTQMIWSKTTNVGCAIVPCSGGAYILVCNYDPAGNYFGESPLKNMGELKQVNPGENPPKDMGEEKPVNPSDLGSDQIKEFLEAHNSYRAEVNSDPLIWNDQLASYAKAWAEYLAQTGCEIKHRPREGEWTQKYGENIYWSSVFVSTPKGVVDSWGSEKADYDGDVMNEKNFHAGHYTQMIWSKTTQVGCAIAKCNDGAYIVVCNYNPAGNYFGQSPLEK